MDVFAQLGDRLKTALADQEIPRLAAGLSAVVELAIAGQAIRFSVNDGAVELIEGPANADVRIEAAQTEWAKVIGTPPPPTYHSFTALELANPSFEVKGEPVVVARCRPLLERVFELIVAVPPMRSASVERDITTVIGRYYPVSINGITHNVFVERSGEGAPVLFLHTAGADARQYLGQLSDVELARSYAMWAVDMPFHGRSLPPTEWTGDPYKLTTDLYLSWCVAIIEQVIKAPAYVVGGSMGAAMAMVLAAKRPDLVKGIVAVEPPFRSTGRRNAFQHHVGVHGSLHNASYVRGLMSPFSPERERRQAAWIYSQGAPGIYTGDLAFYSEEFDGAVVGPLIDCSRTPVALLCGTYDYSASPEHGRKLAEVIRGAKLVVMDALGHFPMCENADLFRSYLIDALAHIGQKQS
ncbi:MULTISPECIES: alpha/beta fold hydrolase [unclassified Burkholderia]|uniref:alpha/beta fold hydrolase n=1 Tax=unclassified Burkholderia TaxID=2613784 RepID=UPI000F56A2FF|nr:MULTISPECIES: alpha/beta hydrolase [unclassified Burkholderia]RQS26822.1 alpha/beta hydrolase [Burkholderia sp. Bp8995]RQS51708.1 alpha/beta hydrolase [Burkholderia sp. Bp8989]